MKILFITALYPLEDKKVSNVLSYFVKEWQKQGHEVEVIIPNFNVNTLIRGRKIQKERIYYENGTKIYNLNFHTPFLFNVYNKLPKDFSLKNYDVMISHLTSGAIFANKLLEKEKIRYICAVHASDIVVLTDFKYAFFFKNRLKDAYKSADKIAARSYVLQNKIKEIFPEYENKTFVAFSGIDDNLLNRNIQNKNFNRKKIQISTVSSLRKRKNIDIVLKSLADVSFDYHYIVMGEGLQKNRLENLAKKLGIQNKITFTGKISREEVIENLKKSDIFILLSDNETFGLSYLEAMSQGNIIIAKKNDGIDGILKNNENAFLIEPDASELKKCLEKLVSMNEEEINLIKQNSLCTAEKMPASKAAENYIKNII